MARFLKRKTKNSWSYSHRSYQGAPFCLISATKLPLPLPSSLKCRLFNVATPSHKNHSATIKPPAEHTFWKHI